MAAALVACFCLLSQPVVAAGEHDEHAAASGRSSADVDVAELVLGHIADSYGWHLTTWKGEHITIPLPCIVHSSTGWHVFMSSQIEHGHVYEGLFLSENDKIMEILPDGSIERPFDISITKNVASLMVSALLLIALVLGSARWYRKHDAVTEGATEETEAPLVIVTANDRLKAALLILESLEANEIVGDAASVDVTRLDDVILWYGTQYQVNLGDTEKMEYKIACMYDTILQLSDYQTGVLDVSFKNWETQVGYTPFE